jgi:hypothetical protein
MRLAIHRCSALFFGWIPDVSEIPARRLILIGVAVSAVLHILAFLLLVLFSGIFSKPGVEAAPQREIELVVVPPDEAPPEPVLPLAPEPQRHFLDTTGLDISKVAPERPDFESSENGIAASEEPGKGDIPLPNQEGRDLPFAAFKSQRALFGSAPKPFPADPSTTSLSPPPPDAASDAQDVAMKPPPEPPQPEKSEKQPAPATPAPAATPPPKSLEKTETPELAQATPPPMKVADKTQDDQIAVSTKPAATPPPSLAQTEKPQPKPVPTPIAPAASTPRPVMPVMRQAMLMTPAPRVQPPAQTSRQLEQVQTHIEGSISNRGRRAANTVATPFGKYEKQVHDAIASRWQYYVKDHADVIALGSAQVSFIVDSSGHVRAVRLESNTSNQSFADVCERAIREAELPEPPADVIATMRDGHLEFPMKFTLYPFQ